MQSFINQNTYPSQRTSRLPAGYCTRLLRARCLKGSRGDDGVDEFLALDKFGRFHAVRSLVEKVGQHRCGRVAPSGHWAIKLYEK